MTIDQRIQAFVKLGDLLRQKIAIVPDESYPENNELRLLYSQAYQKNQWFTPANCNQMVSSISNWLTKEKLQQWVEPYGKRMNSERLSKNIGVVMAGNVPMVGFHDALCVLLSGNKLMAKCSTDDEVLLPEVFSWLIKIEPAFQDYISFVSKIVNPDAVIATGSNNSARYFEYYFGKYPHIIRKNRNAIAVLSGKETEEELKELGKDIFSYFGLGCRNVSKLYIPENYSFNKFYAAIESFSRVMEHNKYMNNYDYHHSLFLLESVKFLTNNFLIVREQPGLATPVSVLHYEYYTDEKKLKEHLREVEEEIQCVVGKNYLPFGTSQQPLLYDYADGVDTMDFLMEV